VERSLEENNKNDKEEFIYDIRHVTNSNKTVTICFLIDYIKLLKRLSPFPQLINENSTDENLNDNIIATTLMTSMKLFRRQVKTSINFLKTKQIDPYKSDEIVASTLPEQLPYNSGNNNIKLYSITDTGIANKNEGEYQYYAEFTFTDGTVKFLKTKLNNLLAQFATLKSYYSSCLSPVNYERITDTFKENLSVLYPIDAIAPIINLYISCISQVYNLSQQEAVKLQEDLSLSASPIKGNPTGILKFISLYQQLIAELSRYVSSEGEESTNTNSGAILKKDIIQFKKEFIQVIDSSIDHKVVLDYLNINNGIVKLSDFRNRAGKEVQNYNLNNTNIYKNEYSVSYLSPLSITIKNKKYNDIFKTNQEILLFLKSQIKLLNKNKYIAPNKSPTRETIFKELRSSFIEEGVSFEFLKNTQAIIEIDDLENNNRQVSSGVVSQLLGTTQRSLRTIQPTGSRISSNKISSPQARIDDAMESIEKLDSGKNTLANDFEPTSTLPYPNQLIKFQNSSDKNINNIDNLFKYGLLAQIEYYDGTNWQLLTDTILDGFATNQLNQNIVCRIKKYDYDNFGLANQNIIKYSFTEYFILFTDSQHTADFIITSQPPPLLPPAPEPTPPPATTSPAPTPPPSPAGSARPPVFTPPFISLPTLNNIPNLTFDIGKKPFFDNPQLIKDLMGGVNIPVINIDVFRPGISTPAITASPISTIGSVSPIRTAISTPAITASPISTIGSVLPIRTAISTPAAVSQTTATTRAVVTSENFNISSVSSNSVVVKQTSVAATRPPPAPAATRPPAPAATRPPAPAATRPPAPAATRPPAPAATRPPAPARQSTNTRTTTNRR
jgi:hypothetical protein